jgi:hypothetical protein
MRIRIPEKRRDVGYFAWLVNAFDALPGIEGVKVNALTASLLLNHQSLSAERIGEFAEQQELFRITPQRDQSEEEVDHQHVVPLSVRLTGGLQALDGQIRAHTGGQLDFWGVIFLLMVGLSISQMLKGNIFAPASTLLWYALATFGGPQQAGRSVS